MDSVAHRRSLPELAAWEKRVLVTTWVNDAHTEYLANSSEGHAKMARHCGLNISLDESDVVGVRVVTSQSYKPPAFDEGLSAQIEEEIAKSWWDDIGLRLRVDEEDEAPSELDSSDTDADELEVDVMPPEVDDGPEVELESEVAKSLACIQFIFLRGCMVSRPQYWKLLGLCGA